MLPLSGTPQLLILGREVPLGPGYADLIAAETGGRPVIIEVKLEQNPDARRAVVAQILGYAAHLHGTTRQQLDDNTGGHLQQVVDTFQDEDFDSDEFTQALDDHLQEGRFRLVFVLDTIPPELMTLVAYLEHVTDKLLIDLIAVNSFNVAGTSVVLPQRVTPERHETTIQTERRSKPRTIYHKDSARFETSIAGADAQYRDGIHRLLGWARQLENQGLARLHTTEGKSRFALRLWLPSEDAGLVTIWNDRGAYLQFWRSVIARRAPEQLERIEQLPSVQVGQGNTTQDITDELLDALTGAYQEATRRGKR